MIAGTADLKRKMGHRNLTRLFSEKKIRLTGLIGDFTGTETL